MGTFAIRSFASFISPQGLDLSGEFKGYLTINLPKIQFLLENLNHPGTFMGPGDWIGRKTASRMGSYVDQLRILHKLWTPL
jgi:hypothetical protein